MTIDAQWQLTGLLQGAVMLGLPAVLFLAARRRRFFVRLLFAVVVSWIAGIIAQGFASDINEAHYLAHYHPNPSDLDDYGPSFDSTAANVIAVFFGWLPPLIICLLVGGVSRLARAILRHLTTTPSSVA